MTRPTSVEKQIIVCAKTVLKISLPRNGIFKIVRRLLFCQNRSRIFSPKPFTLRNAMAVSNFKSLHNAFEKLLEVPLLISDDPLYNNQHYLNHLPHASDDKRFGISQIASR